MDIREVLHSGGSVKVTIPIKIVRDLWKKAKVKLSEGMPGATFTFVEKFPVCFILLNGKVVMDIPENVLKSDEYPDNIKSKVMEELGKIRKRRLSEELNKLCEELAKGVITESEFDRRLEYLRKDLKELARLYKKLFKDRELHFISSGHLEHLLASFLLDEEKEAEEEITSILEYVKKTKYEYENMKQVLEDLNRTLRAGKISKKLYDNLRERYLLKLDFIKQRQRRLIESVKDLEG